MGCLSVFGELLDFGGIFVLVLDFLKICKDFVFSFLKNTEKRIASSNPNKLTLKTSSVMEYSYLLHSKRADFVAVFLNSRKISPILCKFSFLRAFTNRKRPETAHLKLYIRISMIISYEFRIKSSGKVFYFFRLVFLLGNSSYRAKYFNLDIKGSSFSVRLD